MWLDRQEKKSEGAKIKKKNDISSFQNKSFRLEIILYTNWKKSSKNI